MFKPDLMFRYSTSSSSVEYPNFCKEEKKRKKFAGVRTEKSNGKFDSRLEKFNSGLGSSSVTSWNCACLDGRPGGADSFLA
jgi:hypothetical protein